ncbi:histidinol-phosphate transaminase [Entomobacter blattae]|uniref:histidinol-phosphate transaminase n=1 Tax=Entomobacter blattae TaxID=2762277 RepID=UPI00193B6A14|nr:histidinol-phosphate transaminase [Entomobacter blattae]
MQKLWSPIVHQLTPYIPGEQPKTHDPIIKLNTNECPYPPSEKVLSAIRDRADEALRLYPDPTSEELRHTIATLHEVSVQNVFVGNGSDEVLAFTFQALLNHTDPLLMPDITYSFYPVYCKLYNINHKKIPVGTDFSIDLEEYNQPCGGIVFANPNAPTGLLLPLEKIRHIAERQRECCIVVDEAYIDFGGQSAVSLLKQFPNIIIIRTLSKSYALAGLRVGYALAHPTLIEALTRIKDSFNSYPLDRLAQAGATAALKDREWFDIHTKKIMASRQDLSAALSHLGFEVLPSFANFVFARHKHQKAATLSAELKKRGLLVRHFSSPRIENFLRISIGSEQDCNALIQALKTIIEQ